MSILDVVILAWGILGWGQIWFWARHGKELSWQLDIEQKVTAIWTKTAQKETKRADELAAELLMAKGDLGQCIDVLLHIRDADDAGRARTVLAKIEPVQCTMCNGDRVVFNGDSEAACPACEGTHPE